MRDGIPSAEFAAMTSEAGPHLELRSDVRRAGDVAGLRDKRVLAEVLLRDVEQPGARRPGGRLPVLRARRRRADIADDLADFRSLLRVVAQRATLEIDSERGRDVPERIRRQYLARGAIDHVEVSVAVGMQQHLAGRAADRQINQHALVDAVVVVLVVRAGLIKPDRLAVLGSTREDAASPFVRPGSLVRVPRSGIRSAVIDDIELWVVRYPTPDRAASDLPRVGGPGFHTQILAPVSGIKGLEGGADQHVLVGTGAVRPPELLAGGGVERREPATNAELAAAVADQHPTFHDERRHGERLAELDLSELCTPELLSARRIERDRMVVERVEKKAPIGVDRAAIDHVAARNALGAGVRLGIEFPLHVRARLGEIEREDVIGIGRDDVHGAADHDRCGFVAFFHARREAECELQPARVGGSDLVEGTEARARVIARGHAPLRAVVRGNRRDRGKHPDQHAGDDDDSPRPG